MKRIISFLLIIALAVVFTGCSPTPFKAGNVIGSLVSPSPTATAGTNSMANSFTAFTNDEITSLKTIAAKIGSDTEDATLEELSELCMQFYYATLAFTPVEAVQGGDILTELANDGYSGFNVSQNADSYTITYTSTNSETSLNLKLVCSYDSATDSMTATLSDTSGQNQPTTFEYAAQSSGYAIQFFGNDGNGGYTVFVGYTNGSSSAEYGVQTGATAAPQSIYKNASLNSSFAESGSFYCKLDGTNLSVTNNGTTTTY